LKLMRSNVKDGGLPKAKGGSGDRHETAGHCGISRRKHRRFDMPSLKSSRKLKYDALGAAIQSRRDRLKRGGE